MTFLLDGGEVAAEWAETRTSSDIGVVLVLCGADSSTAAFLPDLTERLSNAGYASVHLATESELKAAQIAEALAQLHKSRPNIPLSLIAFGKAGTEAWRSLVLAHDILTSVGLVSCSLPTPRPDFSLFPEVAVRGIYAEAGATYASSYMDAHLGMAAVGTPHDFMIYGAGVTDDFYDPSSPDYHEGTWSATQDNILDWLEVRGYLGRPEGIQAAHDH